MVENIFRGLFDSDLVSVISLTDFMFCLLTALILGFFIALTYTYKGSYTKSFLVTLALLPAVVCIVIMMVNGNVGTGVAVAGAFSLVRFRSVPGTAKEICILFLAMGAGLIAGMGYLGFAVVFTVVMCAMVWFYSFLHFGEDRHRNLTKVITVTIPEDLNYTTIFDDILKEYCKKSEIVRVKSTNMGSMFKLTMDVTLLDANKEKEMIDKMRCRNGNLEIVVSRQDSNVVEL